MEHRRTRRGLRTVTLALLISALIAAMAVPAVAEYPEIEATAWCGDDGLPYIDYVATSWPGPTRASRTNHNIGIYVDGLAVGGGAFAIQNGYTFSGAAPASQWVGETVTVRAQADSAWGNGKPAGDWRETTIQVPSDCGAEVPVSVSVTSGTCLFDGELSSTSVTVTIDPASGATVTIVDASEHVVASLTSSGSVQLQPGSYAWTASATDGFALSEPAAGEFLVEGCFPPVKNVSVTVTPGTCEYSDGVSSTPIAVVIDPTSGATLTIRDSSEQVIATLTESGAATAQPGTYTWSAVAAEGFALSGPDSGALMAASCEPQIPGTDLAVTEVGPAASVAEGGAVAYTITVTNNGPVDEPAATVIDTLPATFVFVSANPSQGSCVAAGGVITCQLGGLKVGVSATIVINAAASGFGHYTTTVAVSGQVADIDPANNADSVVTDVIVVLPAAVAATSSSVAATSETLPFTGSYDGILGGTGVALLALGGLLVLAVGRRKSEGDALSIDM